ncbi:MAG: ABC transporter ATP-binding protein [Lachnospiraceae bacterium]
MYQSIKRLFVLAGEHKKKMIVSVVMAFGSVAAGFIPYFFISRFVAEIVAGTMQKSILYGAAAGTGAFLCLKTLLMFGSTMLSHKAAYRILRNIRLSLAEKLTRLPLGYILERNSGIIKKVMENDVEELERFLAHNIPETISSIGVPAAVLVYLFMLNPGLAFSMCICIPLAFCFYALMNRGSGEKMQQYYTAVDHMNAVVVEYVNGMKEMKTFNQSEHSFGRFKDAIEQYRHYVLDWYKACWPFMAGYYVMIQAGMVTVLPVGLYLYHRDAVEFPVLVLFLLISLGFATPFMKLAEFADGITLVVNAERNIHAILSEEELPDKRDQGKEPEHCDVCFNHVSFSYNGRKMALRDISFAVSEGSSLAIVGESGSGKSTIAKLLCRFWDTAAGSICIGGVDIRKMSIKELMDKISFVFQDTFLFQMSLRENIRMGRPEASDDEVKKAAKMARCHEFIIRTEHGYDTLAGDAGNNLSGGEKQRICIARAILKNAPILVLDEATASIDPDCEEQIQEAIGELTKGKTLIVIAHRLRTIMGLDQIIVLQDGMICGSGTHQELMNRSPVYQKMFRIYTKTENWTMENEGGIKDADDY